MIGSRKLIWLGAVLLALALAACAVMVWFPQLLPVESSDAASEKAYESELFGTGELLEIDIVMDEADWQDLLANPLNKTDYLCDVVIDGVTYPNASISTKGNTSLSQIANDSTTDRYSLKIVFDQYEDQNLCQGLDELVLNNNYADASYLKEYFSYQLFAQLDVPASLVTFATVSVNGESRGLYLALEGVDESFAQRNFGADYGQLYKPDTMEMGGGQGGNGGAAGGADLVYTDDELSSYSAIWDSALFSPTEQDEERVVTALKNICQGTELETYLDVDAMLRYLAAHTFTVNLDSLSGTMTHNYYLYEEDGRLSLIPWDYNLAFGGFQSSDATSVVNFPIDTPVTGVSLEDRPIFACLLEVDEYRERYHDYLRQLAEYYQSFEEDYQAIRDLIDGAVESDPTAFYTAEEYDQAADLLYQTITLRAESILGQLDGSIPSTTEGQQQSPELLVDASSIDLSLMGSMNRGAGGGDGAALPQTERPNAMNAEITQTAPDGTGQAPQNLGEQSFTPGDQPTSNMEPTPDADQGQSSENTGQSSDAAVQQTPPTLPQGEEADGFAPDGQRPDRQNGLADSQGDSIVSSYTIWLYAGCLGLLILAFILVLLCQRKRRFRP